METFLSGIVDELKTYYRGDYKKVCLIFPTRRACLIFRNLLAAAHDQPVWSPGVMAIGDFVSRNVTVNVADEIPLLVTLYEVYKRHWPDQDFGKYYSWGKMLLNDFDEIDKQLLNPSSIFKSIGELKKIDAAFLPDTESLQWIHEFVSSIDLEHLSFLQKRFTESWDQLRSIYDEFNRQLDKKNIAYEGKAYRKMLETLRSKKFSTHYERFIFAGFYGFSKAEEEMIRQLRNYAKVDLKWDADSWYVNNRKHEAGYYFRKSELVASDTTGIADHFGKGKRNVTTVAVPQRAGQAKFMGDLLLKLHNECNLNINTTAVILPDENMLFPALYALPNEVNPVNVTMGFPLRHSYFSGFLEMLHDLHGQAHRDTGGKSVFPFVLITRILNHPLLHPLTDKNIRFPEYNHSARLSVDEIRDLTRFTYADMVFVEPATAGGLFDFVINLLRLIADKMIDLQGKQDVFDISILEYILSEIIVLKDQLAGQLEEINSGTAWQMISECVAGLKIPFSGEPVHGLQVMGFLETRALDFETIIVMNVNEGVLPVTDRSSSYIPYALRKGFGLSTYEDREASSAYHFYRLLHRAKNIYLIHNSEVSKTGGGEPGRYLLQIRHELKKYMGERLNLNSVTVSTPLLLEEAKPIVIRKDEGIMKTLQRYLQNGEDKKNKFLSSTSLTTYIHCTFRFYLQYVVGLREKDEQGMNIDAASFGEILHTSMERLYSTVEGMVTEIELDRLVADSEKAVMSAIEDVYKIPSSRLTGSDILTAEVIKELVKRILQRDKEDAPFEIKGLEDLFHSVIDTGSHKIHIGGYFDRVDKVNGLTRIIDYKTGKVEIKAGSPSDLFTDYRKKTLFQLYLYSLLYRSNHPGENFAAGFYTVKNINSGIAYPKEAIDGKSLDEFQNLLKGLLEELYNPDVPFVQTTELERCQYCPFTGICSR